MPSGRIMLLQNMPESVPGRILKIQDIEYQTARYSFSSLHYTKYIIYIYIYIFYTIRNMGGKRFFFNKSAFKMHFFSSKICISLK